jgi:hypothetical protein
MANQKNSAQAKKIKAMGAKSGATKAQVAQGLARAGGKSAYNVTNKDIKRAGKAAKIIGGAAVTAVGPGKVVKAVQAAKAVKAGASARALKAAQGPSLAKGAAKTAASSGRYERAITKMKAETNLIYGDSKKVAYAKAAKAMDKSNVADVAASKKILARAGAEKKAAAIAKNLKGTKPMEKVPQGVSDRFNATVKKLAAENAKKNK